MAYGKQLLTLCQRRRWRLTRSTASAGGRLGGGDPVVDAPLEDRQRQRAAAEHHVVEAANVEALAERGLRARAQLEDLEHADLVARGLARHHDVTADFRA